MVLRRSGVMLGDHPIGDVRALPVAGQATAFAGENCGRRKLVFDADYAPSRSRIDLARRREADSDSRVAAVHGALRRPLHVRGGGWEKHESGLQLEVQIGSRCGQVNDAIRIGDAFDVAHRAIVQRFYSTLSQSSASERNGSVNG